VDPFAVIVLGGVAGLVVALGLAARPRRRAPGPAAPAAEPLDDLDGMLEAVNARRRHRGHAELTADGVRRARP
jgi:hypothetical protein